MVIQECQKEIEKRAEAENEDESDHTGVFTGFVLLSKAEWDKGQFIRDMKEKMGHPSGGIRRQRGEGRRRTGV